jgi:hypothetical protein
MMNSFTSRTWDALRPVVEATWGCSFYVRVVEARDFGRLALELGCCIPGFFHLVSVLEIAGLRTRG